MTVYSYEIGTTSTTTNVQSLATPLYPPKGFYQEWSEAVDRANGLQASHGYAMAEWSFDTLTQAMIDQLRTFCPGKSANVYINTRINDGTFDKFSAVMLWPDDQLKKRTFNGFYQDITIEFRKLVAV